jgi:hypothetical protein
MICPQARLHAPPQSDRKVQLHAIKLASCMVCNRARACGFSWNALQRLSSTVNFNTMYSVTLFKLDKHCVSRACESLRKLEASHFSHAQNCLQDINLLYHVRRPQVPICESFVKTKLRQLFAQKLCHVVRSWRTCMKFRQTVGFACPAIRRRGQRGCQMIHQDFRRNWCSM